MLEELNPAFGESCNKGRRSPVTRINLLDSFTVLYEEVVTKRNNVLPICEDSLLCAPRATMHRPTIIHVNVDRCLQPRRHLAARLEYLVVRRMVGVLS
jgi:hypothetical protein